MQVTESTSDGLKRELKVVIDSKELNQRLADRLDEIKGSVRLKGFRPGKVPVDHLRKIYGRSVMAEIVQQAVEETSQKAVADRAERPAVPPDVAFSEDEGEIEKVIAGQADLSYTLSFEVLPEVKVADLSKIKLEKPVAEVGEEDIDQRLDALAKDSTTYTDKDGKAEDGDQVVVDFEGTIDAVPFDGGRAENAPIVIGSGQFIPGFEDGLLGAKAGDERTLNITFPEDYAAGHLAKKDAVFKVTVKKVGSPVTPEVNDEFAKTLGMESLARLREAIEESIRREYASLSRMRVKRELFDVLDVGHKIELPQVLVDQEFQAIWNRIERELENAGRTFEDEGTTAEAEKEKYRKIAERRVRLGLVLGEIGESADIKVTEEELSKALMERVRQFPGQEQQVYDFYRNNPSAMADLRAPVYEEKVVDYILELADVKEKKVSKDDLVADDDEDVA